MTRDPPRFPQPSVELHRRGDATRAASFVAQADEWTRAVAPWLRGPAAVPAKLGALLEELLAGRAPSGAAFRPYALAPFPRDGAPVERALAVLGWRAAVVSFLSDIWDVVGEPLFELDDCQRALEAFMPALPPRTYCTSCLLDVSEDQRAAHFAQCPARVPPPGHAPHAP